MLEGGGPEDVVELTVMFAREMLAAAGRDDVDPAAFRRYGSARRLYSFEVDDAGSYEGFDVVRDIIRWNRRFLTHFDPRFQFHFVDVYNSSYNPNGLIRPELVADRR